MRCNVPIPFENRNREVLHSLLLHDAVNLLKKITEIERVKLGEFKHSLMRNDHETGSILPVEINVAQSPL